MLHLAPIRSRTCTPQKVPSSKLLRFCKAPFISHHLCLILMAGRSSGALSVECNTSFMRCLNAMWPNAMETTPWCAASASASSVRLVLPRSICVVFMALERKCLVSFAGRISNTRRLCILTFVRRNKSNSRGQKRDHQKQRTDRF